MNTNVKLEERRRGRGGWVVDGGTTFVVVTGGESREFYCSEVCLSVPSRPSCKCTLETNIW